MKKIFILFTIILVAFISIGCKKNTKERNYDYKLDYHTKSSIYEINFKNDNIIVVQKVEEVCVQAPCNPFVIKRYIVEYTKEYEDFVDKFFYDKKTKSIYASQIANADKEILDKIIEN